MVHPEVKAVQEDPRHVEDEEEMEGGTVVDPRVQKSLIDLVQGIKEDDDLNHLEVMATDLEDQEAATASSMTVMKEVTHSR